MKNKKKTWGILLIVLPMVCLPVVLSVYAVLNFVSQNQPDVSQSTLVIFSVARFVLSLLGMASVMALIVGIPLGIILLIQSDKKPEKPE